VRATVAINPRLDKPQSQFAHRRFTVGLSALFDFSMAMIALSHALVPAVFSRSPSAVLAIITVMRPVAGSISTRSGRSPARRAALSARATSRELNLLTLRWDNVGVPHNNF